MMKVVLMYSNICLISRKDFNRELESVKILGGVIKRINIKNDENS